MTQSGHWIDMDCWPRRSTFSFYRCFESPFFNLCTTIDVAPTIVACRERGRSFSLAAWYVCMKAANAVPEFRRRVRDDRVWEHDRLFVGSTVLRDDDSFGFCYFPYADNFVSFMETGTAAMETFRNTDDDTVLTERDDLVHGSVIPWTHFSSMTHARRVPAVDSVPKVVYGRYVWSGDCAPMPVSVEVHHAVADGLHVGRFLEVLQGLFSSPDGWM